MAIILISSIQRWQGHSLDEKPPTAPEGSYLHCVDSGDEWIFHNDGWVRDYRRAAAIKLAMLI